MLLIAAIVIVPLFFDDVLPAPDGSIRTFIVTPTLVAPAPPPPPPPALTVSATARRTDPRPKEPAKLVAPIETPTALRPMEGISPGVGAEAREGNSLGVEGGVPGGVEGGVPGGVVGGIVGGLRPEAPPPAPATIVRVGSRHARSSSSR
jgi:protein TonB